jgi:exosortase
MTKLAKHQLWFAVLVGISLLVGWRALAGTFALASSDVQYTYLFLIIPVSAALIFMEWRSLGRVVTLSVHGGSVLLAIAVLTSCLALVKSAGFSSDLRLSIRMLALALWWIGTFVLCFGPRAARSALFPLCFVFGLVPLPQNAVDAIVTMLQYGSAWAAYVLFSICGVPVVRDGLLLTIPGLTLQIAEACSSIRSSSMLLVTAMVLAQLLLRSPWRKALVIVLAVPLSVAKNGLRIFTIAILGTRVDPGYLTGKLHHEGGSIFFAVVLLMVFALLWFLRRGEVVSPKPVLAQATAVAIEG